MKTKFSGNLSWVALFGLLSFVPLILSLVMLQFSLFTAQQSVAATALLGAVSLISFLAFIGFGVFVHALLLGSADQLRKEGELGFMAMFERMRPLYWKTLRFDLLAFLILIPGVALFVAAVAGTQVPYAGRVALGVASLLYGLAYAWLGFWAPTYLPERGVVESIKRSVRDATKKRRVETGKALGVVALGAVVTTVVFVLSTGSGYWAENVLVQVGVALSNVFSLVFAVEFFFPAFFMVSPTTWYLKFLVHVVNVLFVVWAVVYAFQRR